MAKKTSHPNTLRSAEPDEARGITIQSDEIALATDPRGRVAEQFRGLRNSIIALNPEGAPRSGVLTSSVSGEGKTVAEKNEKQLKLSSFEKKRPVAMVFGSYT